jgi:hypothetical protein
MGLVAACGHRVFWICLSYRRRDAEQDAMTEQDIIRLFFAIPKQYQENCHWWLTDDPDVRRALRNIKYHYFDEEDL